MVHRRLPHFSIYHLLANGLISIGILTSLGGILANPGVALGAPLASDDQGAQAQANRPPKIAYLPMLINGYIGRGTDLPIMLGMYQGGSIYTQSEIYTKFLKMDEWVTGKVGGRSTSLVGLFLPYYVPPNPNGDEYKYAITVQLNILADNGYTPFINISFDHSAADLASGKYDTYFRRWAQAYKDYTKNGTRGAFIAPLPEMNGTWYKYTLDPPNYKKAFIRIQQIFRDAGVPAGTVRWVFAPNGWNDPRYPSFEQYYPGNSVVDAVAFSALNFGYCPGVSSRWDSPVQTYNPPYNPNYPSTAYLDRLRTMAPTKPIFLAQTATTAWTANGPSASVKNQWLVDAYSYLAGQKNVLGIIYFGVNDMGGGECPDYAVYDQWDKTKAQYTGYRDAVNKAPYGYISPQELMNSDITIH
ncbi:MAG: hypothetical protein M1281_18755 [Chloroflexi bacterium]|nr:hypothetical protein [Chloroflexota bacterium]